MVKEKEPEGTTVATFRIKDSNLLAIKAIAFWDRKKKQDVFNLALETYIATLPESTLKRAVNEYKKRNL